ncbi:hypothetical protein GY45DRAFT_385850 [Cubamyces sp. BRFM 1775]|nr:hypothetical protein GY45DRAFT_385850 [Cubamyces sp. BRFM 1775]
MWREGDALSGGKRGRGGCGRRGREGGAAMRSEGGMLAGSALDLSQLRTHSLAPAHSAVATAAHSDPDRSSPMSRPPRLSLPFVTHVTLWSHTAAPRGCPRVLCPVRRRRGEGGAQAQVQRLQHTPPSSVRLACLCLRLSQSVQHSPPALPLIPSPVPCSLTTSPSRLRGCIPLSSDWFAQLPSPAGPCTDHTTGTVLVGLRASLASVLTQIYPASTCHPRPLFLYATRTAALRAIYDIFIASLASICPFATSDTSVLYPCKVP